jgi:hypothetical protein
MTSSPSGHQSENGPGWGGSLDQREIRPGTARRSLDPADARRNLPRPRPLRVGPARRRRTSRSICFDTTKAPTIVDRRLSKTVICVAGSKAAISDHTVENVGLGRSSPCRFLLVLFDAPCRAARRSAHRVGSAVPQCEQSDDRSTRTGWQHPALVRLDGTPVRAASENFVEPWMYRA